MIRWVIPGLLLVALSATPTAAQSVDVLAYPDHRKLLTYNDKAGNPQDVKTPADWQTRRAHILKGMQRAMGLLPSREEEKLPPLDVQIKEQTDGDGFLRIKLSYLAEAGDRVPAWLFLPRPAATERRPAMLALHQTTKIGKDEPAGLGGKPNLHYGLELAQRGYVVLAPDYPSFGEYPYDFTSGGYTSGTMKGIFNHLRAVDLLSERPEVDVARIGVIGHSLGGHNAMFAAAFDERLKVVVSSCGWTPFHDYYGGKIAGWTSDRYMPRLKTVYELNAERVPFEFQEVVASFAPRAFFSNSPVRDDNFDVQGVKQAVAEAGKVYHLLAATDRLQAVYPECGHDFPPEIRRQAYQFIDKMLAHQPSRQTP